MGIRERREYAGRWRRLVNSAGTVTGSIHDDAVARSLGFSDSFVPGSTVAMAPVSSWRVAGTRSGGSPPSNRPCRY
jgi:hypothetical protein